MDDLLARLEPIVGCIPLAAFIVVEVAPGDYRRTVRATAHMGALVKAVIDYAHECHDTANGTH